MGDSNLIRRIYDSICARIYSVGKQSADKKFISNLYANTLSKATTVFYPNAQVVNLQNDPKVISLGENCHIFGQLTVYRHNGKISIGDHCTLGDMSRIVSGKNIQIGNRVLISHNVNILDNNSHPLDAALRHKDFIHNFSSEMQNLDLKGDDIIIEDDVWIGFNCIILKGVRIGQGAVIGAGSIVTSDIEPWTVNVGNPLRVVRKLEPVKIS